MPSFCVFAESEENPRIFVAEHHTQAYDIRTLYKIDGVDAMLMAVTEHTEEKTPSFDLAQQLEVAFKAAIDTSRLWDITPDQPPQSFAIPFFPGEGGLTHIRNAMAGCPEIDFNCVAAHPIFTTLQTLFEKQGVQITNAHKSGKGADIFLTIEKM